MNSPKIAFLLPNFIHLKKAQKEQFLSALSSSIQENAIVLLDYTEEREEKWPNLVLVHFQHSKFIGDCFRTGLSAALAFDVEKIVTFEYYSVENASWFKDYINGGNLVETGTRNFREMLATEISNLLSFSNTYNNFSFNRIFTREAAFVLKDTKLNSRSFMVESINMLNSKGIPTTEVIKRGYGRDRKKINLSEMAESIIKSINKNSINYSLISSLSYTVNILMIYTSLSFGFFYPLAVLVGGELSGISNFIMNEKINFKNKGFLKSAYRFGKFNAFVLGVVAFDILIISLISKYSDYLGKTLFSVISVFSVILVSAFSLFMTNRVIWGRGNNQKVFL